MFGLHCWNGAEGKVTFLNTSFVTNIKNSLTESVSVNATHFFSIKLVEYIFFSHYTFLHIMYGLWSLEFYETELEKYLEEKLEFQFIIKNNVIKITSSSSYFVYS